MASTQLLDHHDQQNIELCVNYIEQGNCILFLGPQFARNHSQTRIHESLKGKLADTGFEEKLDFNFDNLFIFKSSKPGMGEKMRLNMELKRHYDEVEPHPIYQQLPYIPFSAIISCSPDHFLKSSYDREKLPVHFRYYSQKGVLNAEENAIENWPILYNVFGYIQDEDSLITTYENFFKFIISIMGEEQQLPLELRDRLAQARIFLFMGFDMTKWYIPLLVHKLNSFKQDGSNTPTLLNKDNKTDETTAKYFPIELLFLNGESVATIGEIYEKLEERGCLHQPDESAYPQAEKNLKEKLNQLLADNEIESVFERLKEANEAEGEPNRDVILLESRYQKMKRDRRLNQITHEQASLEESKIINALLDLIDELK